MKSTTIKVENDIPIPPLSTTSGVGEALRRIDVGQSVFIRGKSSYQMSGIISPLKKIDGKDFTSRTMDGGVRIWRTK